MMILTVRARIVLILAAVAVFLGVLDERWASAVLGTALFVWFGLEWFMFQYYVQMALRKIRVNRRVSDRSGAVRLLWAKQHYDVATSIELPSSVGFVHVQLAERVPVLAEVVDGETVKSMVTHSSCQMDVSYRIRATQFGPLLFLGIRLELTDLQGLFVARRFISHVEKYEILPSVLKVGSLSPKSKRANLLPPPGIHQHQRAGIGSELLEIREYTTGDSPRSIAWKLSAKRGVLLSKQYESEVPIRCNLMIDVSDSVKLGIPRDCPLHTFVELASSLIETVTSSRDPIGLTLFDGGRVNLVVPSANRKSIIRMVKHFTEAVATPPKPVDVPVADLLEPATVLAREIYPQATIRLMQSYRFKPFPWRPMKRQQTKMKFHMAGILAAHYRLGSTQLGQLLLDERLLSWYLQKFLYDHQVGYCGPLYDMDGNNLFAAPDKMKRLAKSLQYRIAKGRDNELFVIMADFVDCMRDFAELTKAIRLARAKHHRVVCVFAWPPNEPQSHDLHDWDDWGETDLKKDRKTHRDLLLMLKSTERRNRVATFSTVKAELSRLGVPVICALDQTATRFLLAQMELIRAGRVAL